jgi:ankyrin repeat protein
MSNQTIFSLINRNSTISEIIPLLDNDTLNTVNDDGLTPLMLASEKGMEELTLKILDYPIKLDISNNNLNYLFYAIKNNLSNTAIKIIDKSIESNIDLNINFPIEGDTILSIACKNKLDTVILKILITFKDKSELLGLDFIDKNNNSILMNAIDNNLTSVAINLLEFGFDKIKIQHKNNMGLSALDIAKSKGLNDVINMINVLGVDLFTLIDNSSIAEFKQSINTIPYLLTKVNKYNQTPLIYALIRRRIDMVMIIIDYAKTNGPDSVKLDIIDDLGLTPLMYSCISTDFNQVALSILDIGKEKGSKSINLSHKNVNNDTAFIWACEKKLSDIAIKILEFSIEDNLADIIKNEQTTLIIACNNSLDKVALRLLELNIDTSKIDNLGYTALIYACMNGLANVALILLDKSADDISLEQITKTGYTALMAACENSLEDVVIKMLDFKPNELDIEHINFKDETVLMISCQKRLEKAINKMLDLSPYIIKLGHVNKAGNTAFMLACYYSLSKIAIRMLDFGADKIKLEQVNNLQKNAFNIANDNKLVDVISYINILTNNIFSLLDNDTPINIVEQYIKTKPDTLNTINSEEQPFIIAAMWKKRPDIVNKILDLIKEDIISLDKIKLDYIDERGLTPLMIACILKYNDIALKLLDLGDEISKLSYINTSNNSALLISIGKSLPDVANKILDLNSDNTGIDLINDNEYTPIMCACKNKLHSVSLKLLDLPIERLNLSHINRDGDSAFILLLRDSINDISMNEVAIKMLSKAKSFELKLDLVGSDSNTALQLALINKHSNIALELLKDIYNLNILNKNKDGKDAILIAEENNFIDISEELINHKNTDIFLAIKNNKSKNDIDVIIDKNNDTLFNPNNNDQTPLIYACSIGNSEIANYLITYGPEANVIEKVDDFKNNALIYACKNNMSDVALNLINMDGSFNIIGNINNFGYTPLIYAIKNDMKEVALNLLDFSSNLISLSQTAYGNSALIEACIKNDKDIINSILKFKPVEYNISQIIKEYNRIIDNEGNTVIDKIRLSENPEFINLVESLIGKELLLDYSDDITNVIINNTTEIIEPLNMYKDILDYNNGLVNAQQFLDSVGGSIIIELNKFLYGTTTELFDSKKAIKNSAYPCKAMTEKANDDNIFKNIKLFNLKMISSIPINGMVSYSSIEPLLDKPDTGNRIFKLVNTNKRYISPVSISYLDSKGKIFNEPHCNINGGFIYDLVPQSIQQGQLGGKRRKNKKVLSDVMDLATQKNNYFNLSKESKKLLKDKYSEEELTDGLVDYFDTMNIPYPHSEHYLSDKDLDDMYNRLKNYNGKWSFNKYDILDNEKTDTPLSLTFPKKNSDYKLYLSYIPDADTFYNIDNIVNYFTEKPRLNTRKFSPTIYIDSPINGWNKYDKYVRDAIQHSLDNDDDLDAYNLREGVYSASSVKGCPYLECMNERASFYVMLLKELNEIIKENNLPLNIFDVCSGWGDRLLASMSLDCNKYVGIDPNSNLRDGYTKMIRKFGNENKFRFISDAMPGAKLPDDLYNNSMSIVFFSPPPFIGEIYSDDYNQSINLFNDFDSWVINFLLPSIDIIWMKLNDGGVLVVDSGFSKEINTYIKNFVGGAESLGAINIQASNRNKPLWIWKKTNKKNKKNKKEIEKVFSKQVFNYLQNL